MAKVSICIPAYKDVAGICRLMNSILEQSYRYFEIIITDDSPGDAIEALIKSYAPDGILLEKDGTESGIHVIYSRNEKPLGPAGNWNHAIEQAGGEYIKIMHQDDCFTDADSLKSFVLMLDNNPDAILAFSGSRQVTIHADNPADLSDYYDRHITEENHTLISQTWKNLYLGGFIGAPSAVIYRNCDARFDPELKWLIDGDFYMNLLKREGVSFVCDNNPLVSIGVSENQLTNSCATNSEVNIFEYRYLFRKYNLYDEQIYREKLINVILEYQGCFSDISDLGITRNEYYSLKKISQSKKREFYKNLILRKLHLKK